MHRIELTPVYVLHTRPFRNTSLIVELFSEQYGRVAAVARSARGPKSRYRGQLQLFTPILASWYGRHELKSLREIELGGMPIELNQKPLFCGFYFNEILMRLLAKEDPHPRLFQTYQQCLQNLSAGLDLPSVLRIFEKTLLNELGYALPLTAESTTDAPIQPDCFYAFSPQHGFSRSEINTHNSGHFSGKTLLAMHAEDFSAQETAAAAKRLMRIALKHLLGEQVLRSRELFT